MSVKVKMKTGIALALDEMLTMLLFKTEQDAEGKDALVPRELPFNLRWKLERNKGPLDEDVAKLDKARLQLIGVYGDPCEDGEHVAVTDPEKQKIYRQHINDLLDAYVEHSIEKVDPEDLKALTDTDISFSSDAMKILAAYMVDDDDYLAELSVSNAIEHESETLNVSAEPKKSTTKKSTTKKASTDTAVKKSTTAKKTTKKEDK